MSLKLYKRGKSSAWYIRGTVNGRRIFETTGTVRKAEAQLILARRQDELFEERIFGPRATITFVQAAAAYVEAGGDPTYLGCERPNGTWDRLIGYFGETKLKDIGQQELNRAADTLKPKASPATKKRQIYTPFIAVHNFAAEQEWVTARKWRRPKKKKGTAYRDEPSRAGTENCSYEEAAIFIGSMRPAPGMVMTTLFYTGMRPIELFCLDPQDIDVEGRWIVVRNSKTGQARGVPMHEVLVPLFTALKERGGPLWLSQRGAPYPVLNGSGGQMKTAVAGAQARTGLSHISPYTARHTVRTSLYLRNVRERNINLILGHDPGDTPGVYTHIPNPELIEAINCLPVPEAILRFTFWDDPAGAWAWHKPCLED